MILPLLQSRRCIRKFQNRPLQPEQVENLTERRMFFHQR
jgi:hypothetical protein